MKSRNENLLKEMDKYFVFTYEVQFDQKNNLREAQFDP